MSNCCLQFISIKNSNDLSRIIKQTLKSNVRSNDIRHVCNWYKNGNISGRSICWNLRRSLSIMQSYHLLTDFGVIRWMSWFYANQLSVRYLCGTYTICKRTISVQKRNSYQTNKKGIVIMHSRSHIYLNIPRGI